MALLEAIAISPETNRAPVALLVALHGWGANANDVAALAPLLNLPDWQMAFPHAPMPYPYADEGRMWYDLESAEHPGLADSRDRMGQWLQSLPDRWGIPLDRTVLCGFSQGGAMALDVGLQLPLAGVASLSGYFHSLPAAQSLQSGPAVLVTHGRQDLVVPIQAAWHVRDELRSRQANLTYLELDGGHEIQLSQIAALREFALAAVTTAREADLASLS